MPVSRSIPISVLVSILYCGAAGANPPRIDLPPAGNAQIQAMRQFKESWTPAERKLSTELVIALRRAEGDSLLDQFPDLETGRDLGPDDLIEVEVHGLDGAELGAAVSRAGAILSMHRRSIRARMPVAQTLALATRDDVRFIRRDLGAELRKTNTSQGDNAHEADLARLLHGVDGSGIKIGVLSDGVDSLATRQATGDLPAVTVIAGQAGAGDEGTAMLEIVHDLAPGAQLYFATALDGMPSFASNIATLAAAGCNIIVDDVFYFAEPTFQDGEIARVVNDFTDAGGLYFSSAGNSGNLNDGTSGVWEGDFSDAATDAPILDGLITHDFGTGSMNRVTADSPSWFILQWSDPQDASANDYDFYLMNNTGTSVLDVSLDWQTGTQDPLEAISSFSSNHTNAQLAIHRFNGESRFLWMNTNRGRLAQNTAGQTSGHATAANAFGVAATWWALAGGPTGEFDGTESVEPFSSDGPRRMFFDENGTPYTPGNFLASGGVVRQQPKITAADGVSTAAQGLNPFFGTSAAAPHAAAIAALVMENSNLTPSGFEQLIRATALDIEGAGFDRDSGSGILMASAAVNTTLPDGVGSPECSAGKLALSADPNHGPQTFRACGSITAGDGAFDELTLIAYDDDSATPGTITLQNGFVSNGPLSLRTTSR